MVMQTRTKLTGQLGDIKDYIVRFKEKCVSDVRASGLAATGDRGAQEGLAGGRKAAALFRARRNPELAKDKKRP